MRVYIFLALLSLAAAVPLISSPDDDELDSLTAATLETVGSFFDEEEEHNEESNSAEDFNPPDTSDDDNEEVINAILTEDGMIEIEDMVLTPEMFQVLFPAVPDHQRNSDYETIHTRAAISSKAKRWPSGRIPYAYSKKLVGSQAKIRAAMDEWEKHTCVRFEYRNKTETRYVLIRTKFDQNGKMIPSCSSAVGANRKKQYLNLSKNCFAHKIILHELGHTLGLIHEHQHPSRDQHVTIVWNNINPKKKGNFRARSKGVSAFGIPYDPTSIMHYRSTAFRKGGCTKPCYTITSKEGDKLTRLIGSSKHLSRKSDIPIINKMYCKKSAADGAKTNSTITNPNTVVGF